MGRDIKVKILPDGSVKADFTGFAGGDCVDESDRLARLLARFGLKVNPIEVTHKTPAQIRAEAGDTEESGEWVPTKRE